MKTLFFETAMGASGDMILGALLELLPDKNGFLERLNHLGLEGVSIQAPIQSRGPIRGTKALVLIDGHEECCSGKNKDKKNKKCKHKNKGDDHAHGCCHHQEGEAVTEGEQKPKCKHATGNHGRVFHSDEAHDSHCGHHHDEAMAEGEQKPKCKHATGNHGRVFHSDEAHDSHCGHHHDEAMAEGEQKPKCKHATGNHGHVFHFDLSKEEGQYRPKRKHAKGSHGRVFHFDLPKEEGEHKPKCKHAKGNHGRVFHSDEASSASSVSEDYEISESTVTTLDDTPLADSNQDYEMSESTIITPEKTWHSVDYDAINAQEQNPSLARANAIIAALADPKDVRFTEILDNKEKWLKKQLQVDKTSKRKETKDQQALSKKEKRALEGKERLEQYWDSKKDKKGYVKICCGHYKKSKSGKCCGHFSYKKADNVDLDKLYNAGLISTSQYEQLACSPKAEANCCQGKEKNKKDKLKKEGKKCKDKKHVQYGDASHHEDHIPHEHHHHSHGSNMASLGQLIDTLDISDKIKEQAKAIYQIIGKAESKAHNKPVSQIHFHEVGEKDAVFDIVAVCLALDELGVDKIYCSPIHVGSGKVKTAHGKLSVPAPATAEILKGIPYYSRGIKGELCTPTGAALLVYFVDEYRDMPLARWEKIGYGLGTKEFKEPNILRVFMGETL